MSSIPTNEYEQEMLQQIQKVMADSDDDALEYLESHIAETLDRWKENQLESYQRLYAVQNLAIAKYWLDDVFNYNKGNAEANVAEVTLRMLLVQEEGDGNIQPNDELLHRMAVFYVGFSTYYPAFAAHDNSTDYQAIVNLIEMYPASPASVALAGICRTELAYRDGESLYDAYYNLMAWLNLFETAVPTPIQGYANQETHRIAFDYLLALLRNAKFDERIKGSPADVLNYIQRLTAAIPRFTSDETIEFLKLTLDEAKEYLNTLLN
ncbi:MAG: hypothetical protein IJ744_10060 [Lachnospiraceae bacterium]|nr:hypothetical protein [Lachnospiraceae bacterium]